jgi:hypothetical protein
MVKLYQHLLVVEVQITLYPYKGTIELEILFHLIDFDKSKSVFLSSFIENGFGSNTETGGHW